MILGPFRIVGTAVVRSYLSLTLLALLSLLVTPVSAALLTVTNLNDDGPGSLREAIALANDGDRIEFAVTGTIALTSGQLTIDKDLTIHGPGADVLRITLVEEIECRTWVRRYW